MSSPKLSRAETIQILERHGLNLSQVKIVIVGIRGYRKRTMGNPTRNDRNIYDDAIIVISECGEYMTFNANVDPSFYRRGIASLLPGIYEVVRWKHRGRYDALQIIADRLSRDGQTEIDEGRHGINFHYGGEGSTWSEGCQTLPKSVYWIFLRLVYALMKKHKLSRVKYLLIEN